ncbi:QueT transporter family protein [Enterococcus sp.]|uniref:QueT transporter family protein n=1 Tax=Enterococcus sp. TaxID=35783 RepID=UPI002FC83C3B
MFKMNNQKATIQQMAASEVTKVALVTALYIVITTLLSVVSFGVFQLRLSEMFNFLPLFNRRYIWAVTMGVAVANINSPLGITDVLVGSISTFLVLHFIQLLTGKIKSMLIKFIITAIVFSLSMFTVASMLAIFYELPFFITWFSVGLGELFSMTIGGMIIYNISKRVRLT